MINGNTITEFMWGTSPKVIALKEDFQNNFDKLNKRVHPWQSSNPYVYINECMHYSKNRNELLGVMEKERKGIICEKSILHPIIDAIIGDNKNNSIDAYQYGITVPDIIIHVYDKHGSYNNMVKNLIGLDINNKNIIVDDDGMVDGETFINNNTLYSVSTYDDSIGHIILNETIRKAQKNINEALLSSMYSDNKPSTPLSLSKGTIIKARNVIYKIPAIKLDVTSLENPLEVLYDIINDVKEISICKDEIRINNKDINIDELNFNR